MKQVYKVKVKFAGEINYVCARDFAYNYMQNIGFFGQKKVCPECSEQYESKNKIFNSLNSKLLWTKYVAPYFVEDRCYGVASSDGKKLDTVVINFKKPLSSVEYEAFKNRAKQYYIYKSKASKYMNEVVKTDLQVSDISVEKQVLKDNESALEI